MQTARTPVSRRALFEDGLGRRYAASGPGGEPLEVLALRDELTAVSSFEFALRERVSAMTTFQHPSFARIRAVQRVVLETPALAVVTDAVAGARLSNVLSVAEAQLLPIEINAAMYLIRQLVHAIAMLHEKMPGMSHGAIAPERLVITPDARLVVLDHALGAALEQLQFSHDRYWKELSIPLPPSSAEPHFDQRADVMQMGTVALALIVGRRLYSEEYPDKIGAIAGRAWGVTSTGSVEPLPTSVRTWLARALQLDARQSFASAVEARAEFDRVIGGTDDVARVASVRSFLSEYGKQAGADGVAMDTMLPVIAVSVTPPPTLHPVSVAPALVPAVPSALPVPPVPVLNVVPAAAVRTPGPFLFEEEPEVNLTNSTPWWRRRSIAAAVVLVALATGGTIAGRSYLTPSAAAEGSGALVIETNPAGAQVVIDGQPRGVTPLTLALPPGTHQLELVNDGASRTIPFVITAGGVVSQFIELPRAGAATGQLEVRSEPSGARVTIDGMSRGVAPLRITGLLPGAYAVVLANDLGSVSHQVRVEAGATASLVVPMTAPQAANVSGWIAVTAPADVQVYEDTRLLGSSRSERIMVSAGRHNLDIVNDALGYRATRTVNVSPGQVAAVRLEWPKGSMSLNAQPWADVWIDGERVGETPIGNVAVPIGTHEVVFRHPELGEQAVRTTVTLTAPARLSVDLRKR